MTHDENAAFILALSAVTPDLAEPQHARTVKILRHAFAIVQARAELAERKCEELQAEIAELKRHPDGHGS